MPHTKPSTVKNARYKAHLLSLSECRAKNVQKVVTENNFFHISKNYRAAVCKFLSMKKANMGSACIFVSGNHVYMLIMESVSNANILKAIAVLCLLIRIFN